MPVTKDKPAPYAPGKTILDIINRYRDRGLPLPINSESLGRIGTPETLHPRVIQSLRALDLIAEDGRPTATFDNIKLAPDAEFKKRLEDWLKGAYGDIFSIIDPAKDGEERIQDAFRGYQPEGQRHRMVTLFQGLCVAAGLMSEKPARAESARTKPAVASAGAWRARQKQNDSRQKATPRQTPIAPGGLPPSVAGLLASLPADGDGWTADKRDKFLAAFRTILDLCYPIITPADQATPDADDEDEAA